MFLPNNSCRVPEESFLSLSQLLPPTTSAAPWFRHKRTRTHTCMRSCSEVLITWPGEAGGSLTSASHKGIFKKWNYDNEERNNACVIENVQYMDMTIWSQGATQMGMMCLKMDLGLKEMRTLSLMRGQITAADVVDGDWMKSESRAKVVLDDDLTAPPLRFD